MWLPRPIWFLVVVIFVASADDSMLLRKGVIFRKIGKVGFSDGEHHIVMSVSKDIIAQEFNDLENSVYKLDTLMSREPWVSHKEGKVSAISSSTRVIRITLGRSRHQWAAFQTSIKHRRVERGIGGMIGTLVNALFGVATSVQIQLLKKEVENNLHRQGGVINSVISIVNSHSKTLDTLIQSSNQMKEQLFQLYGAARELETMQVGNDWTHEMIANCLYLNSLVFYFALQMGKLSERLEFVMATGKIEPDLLNSQDLKEILKSLSKLGVILPFSIEDNEVFRYYEIMRARVEQSDDLIFIIITFPINLIVPAFQLFDVDPFWVPVDGKGLRLQTAVEKVAVGQDMSLVVEVPNLEKCRVSDEIYICPHDRNFKTYLHDSCLINLINDGNFSTCSFDIVDDFGTDVRRFGKDFFMSVDSREELTYVSKYSRDVKVFQSGIHKFSIP